MHPVAVPQGGTDPGKQFGSAERFGYVIISTKVKSLHLFAFRTSGGDHDDGDTRPCPHILDDLISVHIGKSEIKKDKIRTLRTDET